MITILFVDDEPNILQGLQRMLRPMRHEWEMCFAQSGAAALAILAEKNVEIIVSDMKMPGMDGAQLLTEVSTKYPHIVRIILSGYSEKEFTVRASGTAQEYLAKPCDMDILKNAVNAAGAKKCKTNADSR